MEDKDRTIRRVVAVLLIAVPLLALIPTALFLSHTTLTTQRAVATNWGVALPAELSVAEEQREPGRDGSRFTVLSVPEAAPLTGSCLDPTLTFPTPLNSTERRVIDDIEQGVQPLHRVDLSRPGLTHRTISRTKDPRDTLVCIYDPGARLLYVYEWFM